ncbi:hypothetical protein B0O80DRAFT_190702 [Mortierella sp. GBAus27b]|nr:hypothetical protein B0O80DRAFT_190702 [Mortierella sp. GBAus27b]
MSMSPANASNRSANDGQKKAEPSETRTNLQRKYEEISSLPPWHAVSEFAKDLYLGRELEMKLLDINVNDLPDYQGRLLTLAVDRLKDCMDKEGDAFNVALAHATVNISCTLDISQRVDERFFTAQDVEKASDALAFTPPEWKGVNFAELAKCLKEKGFNGLERRLVALKERFYSLTDPDAPKKPEESEETPPEFWLETLELLQFLAGKIGPRSFVNLQDLSKVDLDSVWKEVLWMMAPDGFMTKS